MAPSTGPITGESGTEPQETVDGDCDKVKDAECEEDMLPRAMSFGFGTECYF